MKPVLSAGAWGMWQTWAWNVTCANPRSFCWVTFFVGSAFFVTSYLFCRGDGEGWVEVRQDVASMLQWTQHGGSGPGGQAEPANVQMTTKGQGSTSHTGHFRPLQGLQLLLCELGEMMYFRKIILCPLVGNSPFPSPLSSWQPPLYSLIL